ncbi:MAG: aldehyde dehydrogenase family protein [Bacteroidota bacterium]
MTSAKFLVGGEWRGSTIKRQVFNPYQGAPVHEVCQASSKDIDDAITAAEEAFHETRRLTSHERSSVLAQCARKVEERKEDFAQMITRETGKPISFSRAEVARAVFTLTTSAEEAKRIEGSMIPLDVAPDNAGRTALVRRFPLGVIGAITPFNFPLNLVVHKLGPAVASGNTVVLKPSSSAPVTALLLGEILDSTSFPKGGVNIVPCLGSEAEQLITDKRVKLLSFTGSPVVGWGMKARATRKRVVLELGGNAGVIVAGDANLDHALRRIVQGAFGNAGQSCISVQRIYVHESVADSFTEKLVKMTKSLAVGDPMNDRTIVGPMIDEQAARRAETWVREAVEAGAELLCGGGRNGAVLEPTILSGVDPAQKVSCQEVFAPVVTLDRYTDFQEAVERINASAFGLQAGIFTSNAADIFYAYRELEVGGVIVNDSSSYRMDNMPYGGVKESGLGREGVRSAIEEMMELKLLALNFG